MTATPCPPVAAADLHAAFLTELPRFAAHARFATRHVACPDTRADLAAEVLALAWRQFVRLHRRGKDPSRFVTTLALRCSQAVRAGRRLVRSDGARDALSPIAKARHGFTVSRLPNPRGGDHQLIDALAHNTRTPVPEQAAFRLDFPRWRARFRPRTRAVLDALAVGGRTGEVARRFNISQGRVSQLRRAFATSWRRFHEGLPPGDLDREGSRSCRPATTGPPTWRTIGAATGRMEAHPGPKALPGREKIARSGRGR